MQIPTCYIKIQLLLMKQAHKKASLGKSIYIDKTIGLNKTINLITQKRCCINRVNL